MIFHSRKMGKASKWFKGLFGFKKSDPGQPKEKDRRKSQHGVVQGGHSDSDASKHAIAVAAATAAVAEAAVAAAQAAAVVVKLTSRGGAGARRAAQNGGRYGSMEEWAAVTIQSHFRAYLSRRALRALRSLVKLQALVRGHISRKQAAEDLSRMKAIVRAQERARAGRALVSEQNHSTTKSWPYFNHTSPTARDKIEHTIQSRQLTMLKRNSSKSSGNVIYNQRSQELVSFTRIIPMDDERNDKILEVDTGKPHATPDGRYSASTSKESKSPLQKRLLSSLTSGEVQSTNPLKHYDDVDAISFFTAENSPNFYSASSMGGSSCSRRVGPFTPPTKSDGSRSFLSNGYSYHPSYMAYTESSKAKVRSLSAPKQRPQYERSSSVNRNSVYEYGESRSNVQKISALWHSNFVSKAYPGSGRLDRMGMPVRDVSGFSGEHWHRY